MPLLRARASIPFPRIAAYLDRILASLAAHHLTLQPGPGGHAIASPLGGTGWLRPGPDRLELGVEAPDGAAFNRLKHDLTSLIDFVAREERLAIAWTGDAAGAVLPPDLRILTVRQIHDVTPGLRRIRFGGEDLARYDTPDQLHCRLLFQAGGAATPEWPMLDDGGRVVWPGSGRLASRIYTIRRIDAAAGRLEIDFVRHGGDGPGMRWLARAAPGDVVGLLGPAAQGPRPAAWSLLAGDETGLPGIARILEGMPATARGVALIEIAGPAEEQPLRHPPGVEIRWLHRDGAAPGSTRLLLEAARGLALPEAREEAFCWIGAEFAAFRALRRHLLQEAGLPAGRCVAFSHWRRGMSEEDIAAAGASSIAP
ncbi:siderophore-interacting protein [Pseudoroseomonas cervicalis]|uniref:siderophore-interacting protein n=1 Tax=Teichococcus cervicalis TaxID=204525 RepID=UPI002784B90D|nr:siderophore-interacting protein [Pseudoroseomonas cervicalis]MDQ1081482.1 NADPH-dependent ferric siderophore reductase [Pseudoroseomonas cervicalis]